MTREASALLAFAEAYGVHDFAKLIGVTLPIVPAPVIPLALAPTIWERLMGEPIC